MTGEQLIKLQEKINAGDVDSFYHWKDWERLRAQVLRMDNYECRLCKAKGKYRRADIVHHVKHLKDRPELALSIWDGEERQLISVCRRCHEDLHPERTVRYRYGKRVEPITEERWD